jgi:hypothetical protein
MRFYRPRPISLALDSKGWRKVGDDLSPVVEAP